MPIQTPSAFQQQLIFWASLLLIISVSAVSFVSTSRLLALSERAAQSQNTLTELNRYLSDLQDVETGTRGYVITGNRAYLEPYHSGKAEAVSTFDCLRGLAASDKLLAARLPFLEQIATSRIAYADEVVNGRARSERADVLVAGMDGGRRETAYGRSTDAAR